MLTCTPLFSESSVGKDRCLVFLHGLLGRGRNFTNIARSLQDVTSSLLVDAPNHAGSAWADRVDYRFMAEQTAQTLETVFSALPFRERTILGHSMGGKTAMVLALCFPHLVDRLVVVDISPVTRHGKSMFQHIFDALLRLDLHSLRSKQEASERVACEIEDAQVRNFVLQNLVRDREDGRFQWEANVRLLGERLPDLFDFPEFHGVYFEKPVLWIRGGRSPYVRDSDLPVMRELFPRVQLVTIPDAGHWVHADSPEGFLAAIRRFVGESA